MFWLFAAFVGAFLSACSNFIDKYLLEKKIVNPFSMVAYILTTAIITVCVFWVFTGMGGLSFSKSYLLILSGVFIFSAMMLYFSVLTNDHVSFVVVFFQLIPILIVIEGVLFFGEKLSVIQVLGAGLVIIAAIALSWIDNTSEGFRWTITKSSLIKMVIFDILWAFSVICIKLSSAYASFPQIVVYEQIGMLISSITVLIVSPYIRSSVMHMIQTTSLHIKTIALFNELLFVTLSKIFYNYAYSYGVISIASVGESSHVLFVVVMGAFLTVLNPSVFKENLESGVIARKTIYISFMLLGIYLIA